MMTTSRDFQRAPANVCLYMCVCGARQYVCSHCVAVLGCSIGLLTRRPFCRLGQPAWPILVDGSAP